MTLFGAGLLSLAAGASVVGLGIALADRAQRLQTERRAWEWRRDRPRARLCGFAAVQDDFGHQTLHPIFSDYIHVPPLQFDPITHEKVQYGWSQSELREVVNRPSEFFV